MSDIVIKNLYKSYNGIAVLTDFNAIIKENSFTGLMAPSGAGKTTLLRIIMGLEKWDSGEITGLEDKRLGVVFQEDRLIENISARSNIMLANPEVSEKDVDEGLRKIGLADVGNKKVRDFSGGMKRRVAILRCLMSDGNFLIFDEPFSGLDENTKGMVIDYIRECSLNRTILMVSHDIAELTAMGADPKTILNFE